MSFPYRTILCPVDFNANSFNALDVAIEIARHFGATMIVMHVLQLADVPVPFESYLEQQKAHEEKLAELVEPRLVGVHHELIVHSGDVATGILETVDKYNPDLLVMAVHGRTGLAHSFLGSVAEAVLRRANCPVLTVRNQPRTQAL
jgi:nucleotide-binding universal stress UspA family protein